MSKLLTSLLATTAFLTLVPTTASAAYQCWEICRSDAYCDKTCIVGNRILTCRTAGFCSSADDVPSDETASVTQDEAQQSEASQLVCSEAQPSTTGES